jgi:methylated-DNA-[protein]-cysteine S-methyltransferase
MKSFNFSQKIYFLLRKIPKGEVTTYKLLAQAIGQPRNWRQIGKILSQNKNQCTFPCYKVVKSNGEVGGYNQGKLAKIRRLRKDGMVVYNNKIKDFKKYLFNFSA